MTHGKKKTSVRHVLGTSKDSKGNAKIEAEYEFPQYSDYEEFTQAAGSPEGGLAFINAAVAEAAGARVREYIGESPEEGTTELEILRRALQIGKTFTPVVKTSNRDKAGILDQILAKVATDGVQAATEDLLALAQRLQ
jgi:hypothetical protein